MLFQDVYETFNILLRRKPKENNFKVDVDKYFKFRSVFHLFPGVDVHVGNSPSSFLLPQGVKLIFFPDSHLAPKFFKVVANSRKVGRHFQRQTKPLFYAVIVLEIK